MIQVMEVDPDRQNRSVLKKYIQGSNLGFFVVKEVENGQQALEEVAKSKVDLVISDIKLAGISGYHLFKKLQDQCPDTKMILYATYTDYEYVQRALEQGLIDYLFKPIKPQELTRTLIHAKQVFQEIFRKQEEQKRILTEFDQRLPVFQDRFLINLVHGHYETEGEVQRSLSYFQISLVQGYTVMVLKIDHYHSLSLVLEEKEKQLFIFSLLYKVEEILKEQKNGIAFINRHDEITMILGKELQTQKAVEIAQEIRLKIKKETKATVTVGIGKMHMKANEINISYKQAKAALRHSFYMGNDTVLPIEYVEPDNHITYQYPLKKEELLVYQVVLGNFQTVKGLLKEIFDSLAQSGPLPHKFLPKVLLDIVVSIHRYASEQGIQMEKFFAEHFSIKEVVKRDTEEKAYAYMEKLLGQICDHIGEIRRQKEEEIYTKAKKYVDTYYFEEISLKKLAHFVKSTPEYVSKIFNEKEKKSLYQYAVKIRIDKAKGIMEDLSIEDAEIAKQVGYQEEKYFQKIFLQTEGISTTDFRNQLSMGRCVSQ